MNKRKLILGGLALSLIVAFQNCNRGDSTRTATLNSASAPGDSQFVTSSHDLAAGTDLLFLVSQLASSATVNGQWQSVSRNWQEYLASPSRGGSGPINPSLVYGTSLVTSTRGLYIIPSEDFSNQVDLQFPGSAFPIEASTNWRLRANVGYAHVMDGGGVKTELLVIATGDPEFSGQSGWAVLQKFDLSSNKDYFLDVSLGTWVRRKNFSIHFVLRKPEAAQQGQPMVVIDLAHLAPAATSALQPSFEQNASGKIGLHLNCNFWGADQKSLEACSEDLDLIKNLGVGSVRIILPWSWMIDPMIGNISPPKAAFARALLNAARVRGLKVLFLAGLEAPAYGPQDTGSASAYSAYECAEVINKPSGPVSLRLDFCEAEFNRYFSQLMDLVLPFTPNIELFNETNHQIPGDMPSYGSTYGMKDAWLQRSRALYKAAKRVLVAKRAQGLAGVLHTQGISYDYNAKYDIGNKGDGLRPGESRSSHPNFIEANQYIEAMSSAYGAENLLDTTIDIVNVHPYFDPAQFSVAVDDFVLSMSSRTATGYKYVWVSEFNAGNPLDESNQVDVFNQMKRYLNENWIQKAFWYVVRASGADQGKCHTLPQGDTYALYACEKSNGQIVLLRPQMAQAMTDFAAGIPFAQRFLPENLREEINTR